jgi:hypothetical protein
MMNKKIYTLTLLILTLPHLASAEEADRGRLPDGRAFRTDSTGIQLVDHVAELELTIESLNRRLQAAENEVKHKDNLLAQQLQPVLVSDSSADIGSLSGKPSCPPQPQFVCPEQIAADSSNRKNDLSGISLQDKVESEALQTKLAESEKLNATLREQKEKDGIWFEQTLAARDQEITLLKAKVENKANSNLTSTQVKGMGSGDSMRAGLQMVSQRGSKNALNQAQQSPVFTDQKELSSFKKSLKQQLEKTRGLLRERDDLFTHFSQSDNSIKIKPSAGHSSNNRTVEQLSKDLDSEQSSRMLLLLSREITDIERQISEDIELVKRVGKL